MCVVLSLKETLIQTTILLHRIETMKSHGLLVFTGRYHSRVFGVLSLHKRAEDKQLAPNPGLAKTPNQAHCANCWKTVGKMNWHSFCDFGSLHVR